MADQQADDVSTGSAGRPATTRRERQHERTRSEIVQAGRDLLNEGEDLTLRAVAHRVGMTPPALYRYVDGLEDLGRQVTDVVLADVVKEMSDLRDAQMLGDPIVRIVASVVGFRSWALRRPREFQFIFTRPKQDQAEPGSELLERGRFSDYFAAEYIRTVRELGVEAPTDQQLGADLTAALVETLDMHPALKSVGHGHVWIFERSWSMLYGTVTLEVFGLLCDRLIEEGHIFAAAVADMAALLGLNEDRGQVIDLTRGLIDSFSSSANPDSSAS